MEITANEIDNWAKKEPRQAQELLPQLVIRLILSTCNNIEKFDFPIGKGVQFPGYDGVLVSNEKTAFLPTGKSVWEFGTDENTIAKLRSDIKKRSENSLGVCVTETTFVFGTLKIWNHRKSMEDTINELKEIYQWKEICIIDASKIALWLSQSLAVSTWMAEKMGIATHGFITLGQFWQERCSTTSPLLNKDFFIQGREKIVEQLLIWLKDPNGYILLKAESTLEATLFLIATVMHMDDNESVKLLSKILIVTDSDEWGKIASTNLEKYIYVPYFNFTEDLRCPQNITAILPSNRFSPISKISKNLKTYDIPKMSKVCFHQGLEKLGYEVSDVYKIEKATKRCFLTFFRSITTVPMFKQPKWLSQNNREELIPAMICGGWNGALASDHKIIEILSGLEYDSYIQKLQKWLVIEDAPIFNVLNTYQVVSSQELWQLLFDYIQHDNINKLKDCFMQTFSFVDSIRESTKEQCHISSIIAKKSHTSHILRQGLIISLIMLSERNSEHNNFGVTSTEVLINHIVKNLLDGINTRQQWNSIAEDLPLLSEASPKAVIEKLEKDIDDSKSEIWGLFKTSKIFFGLRDQYIHVLWTLESLVWNADFAIESTILLTKLCEMNYKYQFSNSPENSLYQIFCLWYPQINLNVRERMTLIEKICTTYPVSGKNLLTQLLPNVHNICGGIHKPNWCDNGLELPLSVTEYEHQQSLDQILRLSVNILTNDIDGWNIIIDKIEWFMNYYDKLSKKIVDFNKAKTDIEILVICNSLRKKISNFRKFKDADWTIPEKYTDKLEKILLEITPTSIDKYKYLLEWYPCLLNPSPFSDLCDDYEEDKEKIFHLRKEAVHDIITQYSVSRLIDFLADSQETLDFANIISTDVLENKYDFDILLNIKAKNYKLYVSILNILFSKYGLGYLIHLLLSNEMLTNEEIGDFLCHTLFDQNMFDQIKKLNKSVQSYYWNNVPVFKNKDMDLTLLDQYISKLLEYNRPFSAVQIISYYKYNNTKVILDTLELFLQSQNHIEQNGMAYKNISSHMILELLNKVYIDSNRDKARVTRIEVAFLPLFRYDQTPKNIINYLIENPMEYIKLVSRRYKSDVSTETQSTEEHVNEIHTAFGILYRFREVPGCNENECSHAKFNAWVDMSRLYAKQIGFERACELELGRLLSYAPVGDDGIYPHEIIREYLEKNMTDILGKEFIVGKQNQRGVYSVTGGKAEKELAEKYYSDAEKIKIDYPKTAKILRQIGDDYKSESLFEQKRELIDFV